MVLVPIQPDLVLRLDDNGRQWQFGGKGHHEIQRLDEGAARNGCLVADFGLLEGISKAGENLATPVLTRG
ncbi:MAG: hypothetical protein OXB98_06995 [Bryobacterales bacterium]|nr:hypothetical protein [Bryobacterales bacterium]